MKVLIFVPAAALLLLGGEGLYHAFISRQAVAIDCDEFARDRPRSHRLLVTGCEIDYAGAGYRESGDAVQEIYLPARPRGRPVPAPLVVATRDPSALAVFGPVVTHSRTVSPQQSRAAMEKVAGLLQASRAIDGLARAGYVERLRSRRILSGLTAPLAEDAVIVDVRATPDFMRPLFAITAGVLLAMVPFVRRKASPEPESPGTLPGRVPPTSQGSGVALPKLLLLSLDVTATPDAVETAPPLGPRTDVIEILTGVIQDLEPDEQKRVLARRDGSLSFDLGSHEPIATVVVDARGEAGVALVKEVLLMTGWRAFAPKTGLFVSVDDLSALGALASGRNS